MRKKKIIIQTNSPVLKTGLAEAGRALMGYLLTHCKDKYEVVYYCTQTSIGDPNLSLLPCKAYGCLPTDPQLIAQLNADPGKARDASYGSMYIDEVVKQEKPDAVIFSDDLWSFPLVSYADKPWHKVLSPIYHITIDSIPILDQAFEQAKRTKYYFTWAKFAEKEMKKFGSEYSHIKSIYGAVNIKDFSPISKERKQELRSKFGISDKTTLIIKTGRNQLRKEYGNLLIAFADFKKENPEADVKLLLHSSWSEKSMGWDFERIIKYHNIKKEDILCTYVCKNCGKWHIAPYQGEDINCPYCGAEKSMITPNISCGVKNEEMKDLYGIADAGINLHTSGGQELHCVNTLMCGLPLACTNYSSGEDFCEQPFVIPINFERRFEAGTGFQKAANSISSVKNFINRIHRMSPEKRKEIGDKGYNWAKATFSVNVIGKQWEELFDSIPYADWSNYNWDTSVKNESYQLPVNYKELPELEFINLLYDNILKSKGDEQGIQNWLAQLKNNITREQIYQYFIGVAQNDNKKAKGQDFWSYIDRDKKNKRLLFVIKESLGDTILCTQLFQSIHDNYKNIDLYVACDPKFANVFDGNQLVHKVIPYQSFMEQEMICIGAGQKPEDAYFQVYMHPAIMSQRQLQYLSINKIAYDLKR